MELKHISEEIERILSYHNQTQLPENKKNDNDVKILVNDTISDYKSLSYDFSKMQSIKIDKRIIKKYKDWSSEQILCIYLKRLLDKEFKIRYSNRNENMHLLFGILPALKKMNDFIIIRFDFKDFFNSISATYIYEKYIRYSGLQRFQKDLFCDYTTKTEFCFAGLNTSNVMAEIIANDFDKLLSVKLHNNGLIFYKRYVDDGFLILNQFICEDAIKKILQDCIETIFCDQNIVSKPNCKTELNMNKFSYISRRNINTITHSNFHFLGYSFTLSIQNTKESDCLNIKYGITDAKIQKYKEKIEKIISIYQNNNDIELLRHRLKSFTSRIVYRKRRYESKIWKAKGFIVNYTELRYHLNDLDKKTERFLKNGIFDVFDEYDIEYPYFLGKIEEKSPYSLYYNMKYNRTLLFEQEGNIGIPLKTLIRMCEQLKLNFENKKSYDKLLRMYLIEVKSGW